MPFLVKLFGNPGYRAVTNTKVLIIDSVNKDSRTFNATTGYFQQPTGEDLYDYSFQFQMLPTRKAGTYTISSEAKFFLRPCDQSANAESVQLKNIDELIAKIEDGYTSWEATIKNNNIVALTSTPWRERVAYKVLNIDISANQTAITVSGFTEIRCPLLEDSYRFDALGIPQENIMFSAKTSITVDSFDKSGDTVSKKVTLDEFAKWLENNSKYVYITKQGTEILEIHGIYKP